jgi:hypothetical protein
MAHTHRVLSAFLAGTLLATVGVGQKKSSDDDADAKEVYNYVLTSDKLQRFDSARKSLQELQKSHPEIKGADDDENIGQIVKRLQKYPEVVAVLSRNSFAPREFAVCTLTMVQVMIAVGSKKAGLYKEYPPEMLKSVSKANLDFGEQHWDALQKQSGASSDKQ